MNKDQVLSLIRSLLKLLGVYCAQRGVASSSDWEVASGVLIGLVGFGWSHFYHGDGSGSGGNGATSLVAATSATTTTASTASSASSASTGLGNVVVHGALNS